ncbi:MAG: hypothetical protein IJ601_04390 [Acidaminococcaceae bacterium]|nr:hypothetical protein [Acidaminococcaceae bacterium]
MARTISINTKVDGNTGEVISQHEQVQEYKYFDIEKGYLFRLNKESIKTFPGCGLPEDLTEEETARLYRLSLTMHKGSNLLCYRSRNVTKAMSTAKIAAYLRLSVRRTLLFLQHMIQRGIIGRVKVKIGNTQETQYYLNPIYFFCGKWLNVNLYFLFRRDLDKVLPKWVIEKFSSYDTKQ